jgi:undecaprenyl-diphosphatase
MGLGYLRSREIGLLLSLALTAGGTWAFIEIADEVLEGDSRSMDRALIIMMRNPNDYSDPVGPLWVEELARDVTALGSAGILTFFTIAAAGFLLLQGKWRATLFVVGGVAGGALLTLLLKVGFGRPRPDLVPHHVSVATASFPSGHAMLSAVAYLTLGALLARLEQPLGVKAYVLALAIFTSVAVGVSRVYLGVHWPSDVLAGWVVGAVWASAWWSLVLWLQDRGKVEA